MYIEDTLVLAFLLGRSKSPDEAIAALKIYKVRRPRTRNVVKSSLVTGFMLVGIDENLGIDKEKIKK